MLSHPILNHISFPYQEQGVKLVWHPYARQALFEGLKALLGRVAPVVYMPEFICRDVLAPFNALNFKIIFYKIDFNLGPIFSSIETTVNDKLRPVFFAVNFFGYPIKKQTIDKLRSTFFVIEDNAHGLWGRDEDGFLLGTRGDLGLISPRKTLQLGHGGALITLEKGLIKEWDKSLAPQRLRQNIKNLVTNRRSRHRAISPIHELWSAYRSIAKEGKLDGGEERNIPDSSDFTLPSSAAYLLSPMEEIERRSQLFKNVAGYLKRINQILLWTEYPRLSSPYTAPFLVSEKRFARLKFKMSLKGYEIFRWPALSHQIDKNELPDYLKDLCLVRFLF